MQVVACLGVVVPVAHIVAVALVILPVFQLIVLIAVGGKSDGGIVGVCQSARGLHTRR